MPASPLHMPLLPEVEEQILPPRYGLWHVLAWTWYILFSSLHHFKSKPLTRKIDLLLAAPAVMALMITLPVIITPYGNDGLQEEKID